MLILSSQIYLLISICFSFLIFGYTILLEKKKNKIKLLGLTFFSAFLLSSFKLIVLINPNLFQNININLVFGEATLLFMLLLIQIVKFKKEYVEFTQLIILVIPIIFIIFIAKYNILWVFDIEYVKYIPLTCLLLLIIFLTNRMKNKKDKKLLIGIIVIYFNIIINVYIGNDINILLNFIGYLIFLIYFHRNIANRLFTRLVDTEEKLAKYHRRINYEVKKRTLEIEKINKNLVNISKMDKLAGAYNKTGIFEVMDKLILNNEEFSILLFDIDKFKDVNDTYGHVVGDKCIRKLSLISKELIRKNDSIGRYGGDEFIIVLPNLESEEAFYVAERLREKVMDTTTPNFTISIGIANYPLDGETSLTLLDAADKQLYISKELGRNTSSYNLSQQKE